MTGIPLEIIANGLNEMSRQLLWIIKTNEESTYTDLKVISKFSRDRFDKEIARLEGAALIEAKRNPLDRRSYIYVVTKYGSELLSSIKSTEN